MPGPSRISGLLTLTLLGLVGSLCVADPPIPAPPVDTDELVRQLGDDSFARRERAMQALSELGLQARHSLLTGILGAQPEIRWRSARLWLAVHDLDFAEREQAFLNEVNENNSHDFLGWPRYRVVLGSSQDARKLFVAMQRAEPLIWAELEGTAALSNAMFSNRADQLQALLRDPAQRDRIPLGSAATMLFLAVENKQLPSPAEIATVNTLLDLSLIQHTLKQAPSLRQLWLMWRAKITDARPAYERLMTALQNDLQDEAQDAARTLLATEEAPAAQKQYALLALVNSKNPIDLILIEESLDDPSPIDTYFTGGVVIKAQLRDVALAALIARSGKDPKEFGFKFLKKSDDTVYSPSTLGFKNDAERDASAEKWFQCASRTFIEQNP